MRLVLIFTLIFSLLTPAISVADDYRMLQLPEFTVQNDMACYDFEDAKKLVIADRVYDSCVRNQKALQEQLDALKSISKLKDERILDLSNYMGKYQTIAEEQQKIISSQESRISTLEKRPTVAGAIVAIVGSAVGGALVGTIIGVSASR